MALNEQLSLEGLGDFLKKLAENSEDVYWLSSPDFEKIQYISPAYDKIWGRSPEELYKNPEIWATFLHPDDVEGYQPIHSMRDKVAELGGAARYREEYRIIRPDGTTRWIVDRGFPVLNQAGECCGVTGVAVDVTRIREHEQALLAAKEAAEAVSKAKSDFIANMSHDLRTPMTGITGMIDALLFVSEDTKSALNQPGLSDTELKELLENFSTRTEEYMGVAKSSARELLRLFNEVLEAVRLESGKVDAEEEVFDLRDTIQRKIQLLRPVADHKNIDLRLSIDEKAPNYLKGLRRYLSRSLLNLVSNALKFTEKGYVEVSVSLRDSDLPASELVPGKIVGVTIQVKDTGIGIPDDKFAAIFENFSRLTSSYQGTYKGSGLGLYTVKQYVKAMQGDIQVESKVGEGSTFTLQLPFAISSQEVLTHEQNVTEDSLLANNTKRESSVNTTVDLRVGSASGEISSQILLVEDNPMAAKAACLALERLKCQIDIADSGQQAIEWVRRKSYDLIFMDLGLPDFDGLEATRRIRDLNDPVAVATPIVALTGHATTEKREECLAGGMQEVLTKPAYPAVLQSVLQQWVWSSEYRCHHLGVEMAS